jgi:hypothetical protein
MGAAGSVSVAESKKASPAKVSVSGGSSLFPSMHGNYILPLGDNSSEVLFKDTVKCPICGHKFENLTVLASKLVQESKDADFRVRYKGVEPVYYDVTSCPNCLYSAMTDIFKNLDVTKRVIESIHTVMAPYAGNIEIRTGADRDTFTVFAGYYLAVLSAPHCFFEHQRITSLLWRNLSRVYDDCGDEQMMEYALRKSLTIICTPIRILISKARACSRYAS